MDLKEVQAPLKALYREDEEAALVTLTARASEQDIATACSIDIGRAIYEAQAHTGVGGAGTAACSGDMLLAALAACAQLTCQMIAASAGIPVNGIEVIVDGDLDLRGTLGVARTVPVGFKDIRARFEIDAPDATPGQLAALRRATEQYCVVFQTLTRPPAIKTSWTGATTA